MTSFNGFGTVHSSNSSTDIMAAGNCCQEEITELERELNEITNKLKTRKDDYHKALIVNMKNDIKIIDLEEKIDAQSFCEFKQFFSNETLNALQRIDKSQNSDSKFISVAVDGLYNGNMDILTKKTVSGRSNKKDKEAITPEKKKILENLFNKRLIKLRPKEYIERSAQLTKLIRNTIDTVNKTEKK